jgi:anthranilate synthase component 2
MAVKHKTRPVYGVQFHPESIATAHGHKLLGNFLKTAGLKVAANIAPHHLTLDETLEA